MLGRLDEPTCVTCIITSDLVVFFFFLLTFRNRFLIPSLLDSFNIHCMFITFIIFNNFSQFLFFPGH